MNRLKNRIFAGLICVLCVAFCFSFIGKNSQNAEAENNPENTQENQVAAEISTEDRLISYLNLNYCFNDDFSDETILIEAAQISLLDFATITDDVTYINSSLIEQFINSFYGIEVSTADYDNSDFDIPEGNIVVYPRGFETIYHELVSIDFDAANDCYTLVTCLTSYGHDFEVEKSLCKSVFKVNPESDYGFNLVQCEVLGN